MGRSKVVVIEDDPLYVLMYQHVLGDSFDVVCSDDSRNVPLDVMQGADYIILDMKLRGNRDGIVEIRRMAAVCPNACLVIVSGGKEKVIEKAVDAAKAHELQVIGHFQKPLEVDAFRQLLKAERPHHDITPLLYNLENVTHTIDDVISLSDVRSGIENKEFVTFFQPQIELTTGLVCGLEALARWDHPRHGTLTPNVFLDAMESVEMGVEFSLNILELALHGLQTLQNESGYPGTVSVKVPMNAFHDLMFPDKVFSLLSRRNVDPAKVILEITEYGSLDGLNDLQDSIARLMIRGIGLSIDDFGTGHSGLSRLRMLGLDELKVDRQFVKSISSDFASRSILSAMVEMAKSMKMRVVVEGVETRDALEWLMQQGDIVCQGYLLAKPMRLTPLMDWFQGACRSFVLDLGEFV